MISREVPLMLTHRACVIIGEGGAYLLLCLETESGSEVVLKLESDFIRQYGTLLPPAALPLSTEDAPVPSSAALH